MTAITVSYLRQLNPDLIAQHPALMSARVGNLLGAASDVQGALHETTWRGDAFNAGVTKADQVGSGVKCLALGIEDVVPGLQAAIGNIVADYNRAIGIVNGTFASSEIVTLHDDGSITLNPGQIAVPPDMDVSSRELMGFLSSLGLNIAAVASAIGNLPSLIESQVMKNPATVAPALVLRYIENGMPPLSATAATWIAFFKSLSPQSMAILIQKDYKTLATIAYLMKPADANTVNRLMMNDDETRLNAQLKQLQAELAQLKQQQVPNGPTAQSDPTINRIEQINRQIAEVEAYLSHIAGIRSAVKRAQDQTHQPVFILQYSCDSRPGYVPDGQPGTGSVVLAIGDPTNAAVTNWLTPGVGTKLDALPIQHAIDLYQDMGSQAGGMSHVMILGADYSAPPNVFIDATNPAWKNQGAPYIAQHILGVQAAQHAYASNPGTGQWAFTGHSYGSPTIVHALLDVHAQGGQINRVLLVAPAGSEIGNPAQLGLTPQTFATSLSENDLIRFDLNFYGPGSQIGYPGSPPLQSTHIAVTPSVDHSGYFSDRVFGANAGSYLMGGSPNIIPAPPVTVPGTTGVVDLPHAGQPGYNGYGTPITPAYPSQVNQGSQVAVAAH